MVAAAVASHIASDVVDFPMSFAWVKIVLALYLRSTETVSSCSGLLNERMFCNTIFFVSIQTLELKNRQNA